jgi:F0F1-type ATP synthase epsilon subunit
MSKDDKVEITFNKTDILNNNFEDENEYDNVDDEEQEQEDEEEINENYDKDTLKYIEKNILEYFNNSPLPLCEFIDTIKIDNFLSQIM